MNFALKNFDEQDLKRVVSLSNTIVKRINTLQMNPNNEYITSNWDDGRSYQARYYVNQDLIAIQRVK
jgi:hypothetical protein